MEKRKKKHSKFWDMVDPQTRKEAQKIVKRIGKTLNIHRFRGFIKTECGD